jgi:hypothetical protein
MLLAIALLIYFGITYAYTKHGMSALIRVGLFALVIVPAFFVVLRELLLKLAACRKIKPMLLQLRAICTGHSPMTNLITIRVKDLT